MNRRNRHLAPGVLKLLRVSLPVAITVAFLGSRETTAAPGDELGRVDSLVVSPQDIVWVEPSQSYFFTSFIEGKILEVKPEFGFAVSELTSPFDEIEFLGGLAYDCLNDTFWILQPQLREIAEIFRPDPAHPDPAVQTGQPTGRRIRPAFMEVVNPNSEPTPRNLAFDHTGDDGNGSLWIVESLGTVIYEVNLSGEILRWFVHPDDSDGFPGEGSSVQSSDIALIHNDAGDKLLGFYVNGYDAETETEVLRRLDADGNYTGFSIPLQSAGGNVSGFLVGAITWGRPPKVTDPAVLAVIESRAEFALLEGTEPILPEIHNLSCTSSKNKVTLNWNAFTTSYDRTEVLRNGELIATLSGDTTSFVNIPDAPGVYEYQVFAISDSFSTQTGFCSAVTGPGQVENSVEFDGEWPVDLTVDIDGRVVVTDFSGRSIWIYEADLSNASSIDEIEILNNNDDHLTGIAAHSSRRSYFVFNFNSSMVAEIDEGGFLFDDAPFAVNLPTRDPQEDPVVIGMDYCPSGNGGDGSLWLTETLEDTIYEIDLEGNILSSFVHPDSLPDLPARFSNARLSGIALVPGSNCGSLDLSGGDQLDFNTTRVLRVNANGVVQVRTLVPLDGADLQCPSGLFGIAHPRNDRPILYATSASNTNGCVHELNAEAFELRPLTDMNCTQQGLGNNIRISFSNNDRYDSIVVRRNLTIVAKLPGDASEFLDPSVLPGTYRYDVQGVRGEQTTSGITCTIRVGAGAILRQSFLDIPSANQITRDPCDDTYFITSASTTVGDMLYHVDQDFQIIEIFENVVGIPRYTIATMAVRGAESCSIREIYVIGWRTTTGLSVDQDFRLEVYDVHGQRLRSISFDPPRPPNRFVTHPVGLSWDQESDTFYFYERNSLVITQFDPEGNFLRQFFHPFPPKRSFVFSVGMVTDPVTTGILSTSAGPTDREITRIVEMTPNGSLTGTLIPLGDIPTGTIQGISFKSNQELVVLATNASMSFAFQLEAFDDIPEPKNLRRGGSNLEETGIELAWDNAENYDHIHLYRNGELVETLPGNATSFTGKSAPDGFIAYSLRPQVGSDVGRSAVIEFTNLNPFRRGDSDDNGKIDINDIVGSLRFQFIGTFNPTCMDALDVDDNGTVDINDPIASLLFQFLGKFIIPPPGAFDCGGDPTTDVDFNIEDESPGELGCNIYETCNS